MLAKRTLFLLCTLAAPAPARNFEALEWRFVGPWRGGRVLSAVGVAGQRNSYYFGSVGGGLWRSLNAGTTWTPIFDSQPVASIGAIAVSPSNPQILYAGTGETDMRSDISYGNGVYRSADGGQTWFHVGLSDSRQIGRILVHPENPDIVFVAALGHAYGPNAERGVYRSLDGGATWKKVLDRGVDVGAVDLAMDPEAPAVIFACMWRSRRPPWSQYGPLEGPGSGMFVSRDGGTTWSQLAGNGLPGGDWGRSGVATTKGHRVYALIDAQEGGLFRSDDGGRTWTRTSNDRRIISRGWYFSHLTADPSDPDVVYSPNVSLYRSRDGGRTFDVLKGAPGGDDYHSLWIDAADSRRMITGSDQGVAITVDGGSTWTPWYNQPTAQMYHVAADNQFPYNLYGSQQDSGTVSMPSRTDRPTISEYDRGEVGGAESGWIAPDPRDPNIVYVGNTYGSLARWDKRTSQSQNITPWPVSSFGVDISQRKYRFPWTAPIVFSPLEPGVIYYGAQFVLKTSDGGLHWTAISPDLTGDARKPGESQSPVPVTVENAKSRGYGVIYSICPSPLDKGLIWAGSDTGLIHLTRDGGKSWVNATPPGLPEWSKVTHIEASHFDPAVAWAAVDCHRLDDYRPHLYRTRNFGRTWTHVVAGIADGAFLNAVREDPSRRGLLFAATELGIEVSFDEGDHWQSLRQNLPVTSVRDVIVHGDDLAIATHGRGFWILDNMTPLRETASPGAHLYRPVKAIRMTNDRFQGTPLPPEVPQASNPPAGAVIDYNLDAASGLVLEILDAGGKLVRRYSSADSRPVRRGGLTVADYWSRPERKLTGNKGMNRFVWDLRFAPPGTEGGEAPVRGPLVLPGRYTVRLTAAGHSLDQTLEVVMDPRSVATAAELREQFDLGSAAFEQIRRARELMAQVQRRPDSPARTEQLRRIGEATRNLTAAFDVANSADRTPPAAAYQLVDLATKELAAIE